MTIDDWTDLLIAVDILLALFLACSMIIGYRALELVGQLLFCH